MKAVPFSRAMVLQDLSTDPGEQWGEWELGLSATELRPQAPPIHLSRRPALCAKLFPHSSSPLVGRAWDPVNPAECGLWQPMFCHKALCCGFVWFCAAPWRRLVQRKENRKGGLFLHVCLLDESESILFAKSWGHCEHELSFFSYLVISKAEGHGVCCHAFAKKYTEEWI